MQCPDPIPNWRKVAIALAVVFSLICFILLMLVNTTVRQSQNCKAAVQPPGPAFFVIWTILFVCVAVAVGFAMYYAAKPKPRPAPILIVIGILILVCLLASWTFVDANQGRKSGAYLIGFIIFFALLLIVASLAYGRTKMPALLLVPLLAWTVFALILASLTVERCVKQ